MHEAAVPPPVGNPGIRGDRCPRRARRCIRPARSRDAWATDRATSDHAASDSRAAPSDGDVLEHRRWRSWRLPALGSRCSTSRMLDELPTVRSGRCRSPVSQSASWSTAKSPSTGSRTTWTRLRAPLWRSASPRFSYNSTTAVAPAGGDDDRGRRRRPCRPPGRRRGARRPCRRGGASSSFPCRPGSRKQAVGRWPGPRIVLADDHVDVAVCIHVGDVEAHRTHHRRGDDGLAPQARRGGGLPVPGELARSTGAIVADDGIEPAVAVDVGQTAPVGMTDRREQCPGAQDEVPLRSHCVP